VNGRRFFLLLIANFCTAGIASVWAEASGVQVRPAGSELIEVRPREVVTTVFRVSNNTDKKRDFEAQVKLPAEWKVITTEFPFELGPHQTDVRLVSFFVPLRTLAGKYEGTYVVSDRNFPSISDLYTISVVILPVTKCEVKLLEVPQHVIAGEDYEARFIVINQGNVTANVSVNIESEKGYPATADTERFPLGPGESRLVDVAVKTDAAIRRKMRHRLRFGVRTPGLRKGEEVEAEAISFVELIPRITGVEDRFHRLPVEIKLRGVMQDREESIYGFQTEISGRGTLDEQGEKHIDFLFRGPDIRDRSILGQRDEYHLSFWTDTYEIHVGDRVYSLSPLTELYTYGRGVEGKLTLDDLTLGAYHAESRWIQPEEQQAGANVKYLIEEKYSIGLNYLSKKQMSTSGYSSSALADNEILSLRGEFEPTKNIDLDLEYGWGRQDGKAGHEDDTAYRVKISGYEDWVSYQLNVVHAGPDFPGYYSDMDFWSGGLAVPVAERFTLRGDYRREKQNLDLARALHSAPLDEYYRLGVDYRLKTGTRLSFDYRNRKREDRLPAPGFDYGERTFGVSAAHSFKKSSVHVSGEWGKTQDQLTGESSDLQNHRASIYFRRTAKESYRGYLEYRSDANFEGEKRDTITAGLGASLRVTERTSLGLDVRTSDYRGSSYEGRDIVEMRLSHLFTNGNRMSVQGRHTSYQGSSRERESVLMVEYTIPFGLPVSRKTSTGGIRGRLHNQETGCGIPNIVLRLNGATAVSDRRGNFVFPCLAPRTYYLRVDTGVIGLDKVTARKTPLAIEVKGGEETRVEIAITRSASLKGQVVVYPFLNMNSRMEGDRSEVLMGNGNDNRSSTNKRNPAHDEGRQPSESYGLANILVECRRESETHRRVTDREGYFRFEKIRPGRWTLKVYDGNLPEYHYFEKGTFEMELQPGEQRIVAVKVLPKKRPIQMIEDGGVLLEER